MLALLACWTVLFTGVGAVSEGVVSCFLGPFNCSFQTYDTEGGKDEDVPSHKFTWCDWANMDNGWAPFCPPSVSGEDSTRSDPPNRGRGFQDNSGTDHVIRTNCINHLAGLSRSQSCGRLRSRNACTTREETWCLSFKYIFDVNDAIDLKVAIFNASDTQAPGLELWSVSNSSFKPQVGSELRMDAANIPINIPFEYVIVLQASRRYTNYHRTFRVNPRPRSNIFKRDVVGPNISSIYSVRVDSRSRQRIFKRDEIGSEAPTVLVDDIQFVNRRTCRLHPPHAIVSSTMETLTSRSTSFLPTTQNSLGNNSFRTTETPNDRVSIVAVSACSVSAVVIIIVVCVAVFLLYRRNKLPIVNRIRGQCIHGKGQGVSGADFTVSRNAVSLNQSQVGEGRSRENNPFIDMYQDAASSFTTEHHHHPDNYYSVVDGEACMTENAKLETLKLCDLCQGQTCDKRCANDRINDLDKNVYHLPNEVEESVYTTVDVADDKNAVQESVLLIPQKPNNSSCDNNSSDCYNSLTFKARGHCVPKHTHRKSTEDTMPVYSHLSNQEENAYDEVNRDRKSKFVGAEYSHIR